MLDAALALRTLLEYYRSERKMRYKLIRDLFFNQPGKSIDGRYSLNFDSFRKVFENNNFPNTSELEKASLYRECYSLGRGVVSPEVFFAVCTDNNFFVKCLRFRGTEIIPMYSKVNLYILILTMFHIITVIIIILYIIIIEFK